MTGLIDKINDYRSHQSMPALDAVLRKVGPPLYLFAAGRVPEAADDVRSKILIAIAKSLPGFKGTSDAIAWAWCYTIARREVSKYLKKKIKNPLIAVSPDILAKLMDTTMQSEPFSEKQHEIHIYEAFEILKKSDPECSGLLWEHFIVGIGYEEMAYALQISYDALRVRINTCLETTAKLLKN